ncbi:hypothetical protein POM88_052696 [Heracleum sosnowskyi]|uniref:RRM domain-containing protein n=1 Tax=Heracleum sosnowskyi TaxID=360622 RepID=A0AAD8GRP4_9APIA|nr:hypothetical protein POM88_052696 [Heracleum sosnowskyi]
MAKFRRGDRQAITDALNQIHWRTPSDEFVNPLGTRQDKGKKTFAEVVNYRQKGHDVLSQPSKVNNGWTLVTSKRNQKLNMIGNKRPIIQDNIQDTTIFVVNIPVEAKASNLWNFFKRCGQIKDIVLPKKRDKNNKRIGFIKTSTELEAGRIISNTKEFLGWGRRIILTINQVKNPVTTRDVVKKNAIQTNLTGSKVFVPKKVNNETVNIKNEDISTKMFEYTGAEVDDRVEEGLFESMVAFSWKEESSDSLQVNINKADIKGIIVVGLTERKFLLRKEEEGDWDNGLINKHSLWFSIIRKFQEKDLILPRTAWIECKGLPMNAWLEKNLKAFTKKFGEWISWAYQVDDCNTFVNPLICVATSIWDMIECELIVLIKGKNYTLKFK